MTVTVVRGFIGKNSTGTSGARQTTGSASASVVQQSQAAVASVVQGVSEAAIANVRLAKTSSSSDKLRDAKEASRLADDVSERIRQDEKGYDSHTGLSPLSARQHFA